MVYSKESIYRRWFVKKLLGEFVINGAKVIYDGETKNGKSYPLIVCPKCGETRRVFPNHIWSLKTGAFSGLCRSCGKRGNYHLRYIEDEWLPTGSVIHWSERVHIVGEIPRVPVTCGRCGTKREIAISRPSRHPFTGHCIRCGVPRGRKNWKHPLPERRIKDEYVYIPTRSLCLSDLALAIDMADRSNYVAEHRLVMARMLGRSLSPKEIVHHLNGVKDDNRPSNLYLVKTPREHQAANGTTNKLLRAEIGRLQNLLAQAGIQF